MTAKEKPEAKLYYHKKKEVPVLVQEMGGKEDGPRPNQFGEKFTSQEARGQKKEIIESGGKFSTLIPGGMAS